MRDLLYRFRPIRKLWWKLKASRNKDFNDRENIQRLIDSGLQRIELPNPVYHIDRTIYLGTGTHLIGTYQSFDKTAKEKEE